MERSEDIAGVARFFSRAISEFGRAVTFDQIRVLDFGCGAGELVERLVALGYDAHGCDIVLGSGAAKRCRKIGVAPYRFPFDDGSFDVVLSSSVLEHAKNPDEYLAEIHRVLGPGGIAMHLFPGKWYLPREPHILVPFANYFYPNCPSWWFAMWAVLGCCLPEHKRAGWRYTVKACRDFYDNGVIYLTSRQHERRSRAVFGNCEWPMAFYIEHSYGSFAALGRKLPMRKLWGLLSREFRMGFLVQRKQSSA